jgi:hypothetical protein
MGSPDHNNHIPVKMVGVDIRSQACETGLISILLIKSPARPAILAASRTAQNALVFIRDKGRNHIKNCYYFVGKTSWYRKGALP